MYSVQSIVIMARCVQISLIVATTYIVLQFGVFTVSKRQLFIS